MGFFTQELARLVGPTGRVIAPDVQPRMIAGLKRRLVRGGPGDGVDARVIAPETMGLEEITRTADFVFAYAVVLGLPDAARFFAEAATALKSGDSMLLV